MTQTPDLPSGSTPYERLGLSADASFDAVQAAKQTLLDQVGDDSIARARVEAAYDAVLMERLKERQQGKVSTAARTASNREQAAPQAPKQAALANLPQVSLPKLKLQPLSLPQLVLASGRELWFPLAASGALLLFLLALPSSAELVMALATGVCLINLQRRSGRFLPALGWSLALLSLGLLLGGLMAAQLPNLPYLNNEQLQSLPAWLLLLLGGLLIA
ncbi:MAG TPA: hypothetical protein DDY43_04270 [Synechococcales bacterium UBA10510]|nr:hypothetical protein [Synechococcales bacterium UBA10510]